MQQKTSTDTKNKKGKRHFFNKIAIVCNHLSAVGLLISYLVSYVSPEKFWFIAFFGLAYPLFLLLNILFVLYWSVQLKKRGIYSLIVILAGWTNLQSFVQLNGTEAPDASKKAIKIMSYNVKGFDLYNWSHNLETRAKIFNLINRESPNVMCFQEFFSRDSSELDNLDSILKFQKAKYVHVEYTTNVNRVHHWGIATFSEYPIVLRGKLNFGYPSNNICIYTDIKVGNDTVRIFNMHLQSIGFSKEDYKYVEELQKDVKAENIAQSKNIFKRLKLAFMQRSRQAEIIALSIASSPYPVIVCGDFNDTPSSYAYNTIADHLNDAFIESGSGFGKSYVGTFPSFRIDYILHSKKIKAYNFKTIPEELSDHYPITCYLEVNSK